MKALLASLAAIYKREPARVNGAVVSGVLAAAAVLGVKVDGSTVATIVGVCVPIIVAELTRPHVSPK